MGYQEYASPDTAPGGGKSGDLIEGAFGKYQFCYPLLLLFISYFN